MRRRAAALHVAVLAVAAVLPTAGAGAVDNGGCVGTGTLFVDSGLGMRKLHNRKDTTFVLTFVTCTNKVILNASGGSISGWCDWASANGITTNGHKFNVKGSSMTLNFVGPELYGALDMVPDVTIPGNNCATGTAKILLVTGKLAKIECGSPATPPNCKAGD
ncbi:MAG TPA: hypothetical protein VHF47_09600 [Acidimicrobiales bacterium]|nr:hypothetical protein [Acidimicrobiales bacterium]